MRHRVAVALTAVASLAAASGVTTSGCGRGDLVTPSSERPAAVAAHASTPPAPTPTTQARVVVVPTGSTREVSVDVEVVATGRARRRGLMYRQHLPPNHGMLFLFDHTQVQHFWMKNTLIPLDMLFIDQAMNVVGVVERAEPLTTVPRAVDAPSRYVLEVNGGWARAHGVAAGATVRFEGVTTRRAGDAP